MIEVKSAKQVQTPGKERLTAMDGLRQTVTAIPKRKIGMAMMALFGLVAYIKTLLGGSEVAAQAAPDTPLEADDNAAPICEMDNSSAENSGSMSFGNAELFQAAAEAQGATVTSPQSSPPAVLSSAGSGLQPQGFDASSLQPLNFQSMAVPAPNGPDLEGGGATDPITPTTGGGIGGGGVGGGGAGHGDVTPPVPNVPAPEDQGGDGGAGEDDDGAGAGDDDVTPPLHDAPAPEDQDADGGAGDGDGGAGTGDDDVTSPVPDPPDPEDQGGDNGTPKDPPPPVTPPEDGGEDEGDKPDDKDNTPIDQGSAPCDAGSDAPCDDAAACDSGPDCDLSFDCDTGQGCDPFAGTDVDCFDDPLLATRDITIGQSTADALLGTDANDLIYAGGGADTALGGAGDDLLIGAAGDDILTGGRGNDRLAGGQGADTLDGGAGDDILTGGTGDDILWDGTGADLLFGDAGNDTIHLTADDAPDTVEGGAGMDRLDLSFGGQPAHIDIAAGTITRPDLQPDSFTSIEIFTAGPGKEVFDLSGFFSPGASLIPQTVFQITEFGYDDTLVLTDDIHLALSDLHAVKDARDIHKDSSDFEARISVFDPETVAETYGRPGFHQDDEDALMLRRIELRQEHETGEIEFDLLISGLDRDSDPSQDFTS